MTAQLERIRARIRAVLAVEFRLEPSRIEVSWSRDIRGALAPLISLPPVPQIVALGEEEVARRIHAVVEREGALWQPNDTRALDAGAFAERMRARRV